jgi:hypothetical protein
MTFRVSIIAALMLAATALAGSALGGGKAGLTDMERAQATGWDCNPQILIVGYFHCAPPGKPSVLDMINGDTSAASIVLRVFNPDDESFAGTEHLQRADLYSGQPCPQDNLEEWELLPFGYRACHHFDA